ncbi:MAG: methyltransferase [Oscillospiraceae bacterium]|jgi:16S rRNA (guanine1207-N2)-methyltransferase|nr:methyltransferase [Oscillospiraceae bacterium]
MPASHYFAPPPDLPNRPLELKVSAAGRDMTFETDAGVFSRGALDVGSRVLLDAMERFEPLSGRAMDLGCGWGAIGIILAARNPSLDMTLGDINPRAAALAAGNIRRNGLDTTRVRAIEGDGMAAVPGAFDWILMNPPIRAGKPTIHRLIDEAAGRLADAGRLMLVWRKQQGAPSAMAWLEGRFGSVERVDRRGGYWVIACEAPV